MRLRTKIGSFVAAVCVVGAIGAAPANAAPSFTIPSASGLSALCKNIKDPKLAATCTEATKKIGSGGSGGFNSSSLQNLIKSLGGSGGFNSSSLQNLLKGLGGSGSTGGIDISKLLGGLGGSGGLGGIDLSKLLSGFKK